MRHLRLEASLALCLLLALNGIGCGGGGQEVVQPEAPAVDPTPVETTDVTDAPPLPDKADILITADESAAADLPPLTIAVSKSPSGFVVSKLRNGNFVQFSGPPGGLLAVILRGYRDVTIDGLEAHMRHHWKNDPTVVAHGKERITMAGGERDAQVFGAGSGPGTGSWCVAIVPSANDANAGALVMAGTSGKAEATTTCANILSHEMIAPIVKDLVIR